MANKLSLSAQRGEEIWAMAGDMSIAEAIEFYGSPQEAAEDAVSVAGGDVADVVAYLEEISVQEIKDCEAANADEFYANDEDTQREMALQNERCKVNGYLPPMY